VNFQYGWCWVYFRVRRFYLYGQLGPRLKDGRMFVYFAGPAWYWKAGI